MNIYRSSLPIGWTRNIQPILWYDGIRYPLGYLFFTCLFHKWKWQLRRYPASCSLRDKKVTICGIWQKNKRFVTWATNRKYYCRCKRRTYLGIIIVLVSSLGNALFLSFEDTFCLIELVNSINTILLKDHETWVIYIMVLHDTYYLHRYDYQGLSFSLYCCFLFIF